MRCNICDRLLVTPRYNKDIKAWEPCDECTEVIQECLNDLKDNAVFTDEDEQTAFQEAGIPPKTKSCNFLLDNLPRS